MNADFDQCLQDMRDEYNITYMFKELQLKCLNLLCVERSNVFTILPTGYGKSDIYGWCPVLAAKFKGCHQLGVVISPLVSLIKDQVKRWKLAGVSCVGLYHGEDIKQLTKGILQNDFKLLFITPEAVLQSEVMSALDSVKDRIAVIAFDEAHCITTWGTTFRKKYTDVRRIRAFLGKVPILLCTATCTEKMKETTKELLGLSAVNDIVAVPDRPNVHLSVSSAISSSEDLEWYTRQLVEQRENTPKAILFCRSIDAVTSLYESIVRYMEENDGDDRIVKIFHSHVDPKCYEYIPVEFAKSSSPVRCLISTIAFGMGMQVSDITYIIHWGPPTSILDYWQEVGRCARGLDPGSAFLYTPPHSKNPQTIEAPMLQMVKESSVQCIRKTVLNSFNLKSLSTADINACCGGERCCSYCDSLKQPEPTEDNGTLMEEAEEQHSHN